MAQKPKNPNDRENKTPNTKGQKQHDQKFTSYDTTRKETSTPQKVRQGNESTGEQQRESRNATREEDQSS